MLAIAAPNKADNMDCYTLIIFASVTMLASGWSFPFYPGHRVPHIRDTRYAPIPRPHRLPIRPEPYVRRPAIPKPERPRHDYEDYEDEEDYHDHNNDHRHDNDHHHNNDHKHNNDHHHNNDHNGNGGVIGPVHTFVKTDKNANYKWGVRHHVGNKHAT